MKNYVNTFQLLFLLILFGLTTSCEKEEDVDFVVKTDQSIDSKSGNKRRGCIIPFIL